jgi:hypothetical protein
MQKPIVNWTPSYPIHQTRPSLLHRRFFDSSAQPDQLQYMSLITRNQDSKPVTKEEVVHDQSEIQSRISLEEYQRRKQLPKK